MWNKVWLMRRFLLQDIGWRMQNEGFISASVGCFILGFFLIKKNVQKSHFYLYFVICYLIVQSKLKWIYCL